MQWTRSKSSFIRRFVLQVVRSIWFAEVSHSLRLEQTHSFALLWAVLFKLAKDSELAPGHWLFGGHEANDEFANKAAGSLCLCALAYSCSNCIV